MSVLIFWSAMRPFCHHKDPYLIILLILQISVQTCSFFSFRIRCLFSAALEILSVPAPVIDALVSNVHGISRIPSRSLKDTADLRCHCVSTLLRKRFRISALRKQMLPVQLFASHDRNYPRIPTLKNLPVYLRSRSRVPDPLSSFRVPRLTGIEIFESINGISATSCFLFDDRLEIFGISAEKSADLSCDRLHDMFCVYNVPRRSSQRTWSLRSAL